MDGAIELVRWDVLHLLKKTKESCFVRAAQKDILHVAIHSNAIIYLFTGDLYASYTSLDVVVKAM